MPTYDAIQQKQAELIRKAKNGSVFLADDDAVFPTTIFTADGLELAALPAGYKDFGWLSDDGVNMPRDVDSSEVTGYGSVTPLRTDLNQDVTTLELVGLETNKLTIAVYSGANPDDIEVLANGTLVFDKPSVPSSKRYRALAVAVDEQGHGPIYMARGFPRVGVSDYDDQAQQSGDDPIQWSVTLKAEPDADAGTAERWYFGGAGWLYLVAKMGFTLPAGGGGGGGA